MTQYQTINDDPIFEVVLEKTGRALRVSEYTLTTDFMSATDSFSFTYYSENRDDLRGLEMQPVLLRINGRTQLVGRIEKTVRGESGSAVKCEGRDYISDLIECNVDPKAILRDGMGLTDAILYMCLPCGISEIATPGDRIDARTGKPGAGPKTLHKLTQKQLKDIKPSAGIGVYETCELLLARFGLTMQPVMDRMKIALQPPSFDQPPVGRLVRSVGQANGNLLIDGSASRDYSSMPTYSIFTGKQGLVAEQGGAKGTVVYWDLETNIPKECSEVVGILKGAIYSGRRDPDASGPAPGGSLYRLLYHRDDHYGKTHEQIANSQKRAIAERLKSTLTYSCTVRGHINPVTGYTWCNDTILEIDDDMADVHEPLWCHSCVFSNSRQGPTTRMDFVRPWSYGIYHE